MGFVSVTDYRLEPLTDREASQYFLRGMPMMPDPGEPPPLWVKWAHGTTVWVCPDTDMVLDDNTVLVADETKWAPFATLRYPGLS